MSKFLFIICSIWSFFLCAEIRETHHFSDVLSCINEDTLLVLDIDDTLLIPVQMLGCDEWFMHRLELHKKNGLEFSKALDRSLAEWEAIRHLTEMEIVEPGTETIIKEIQDKGIYTMGLTTQGIALSHRTIEQLTSVGIDLSNSSPFSSGHYFEQKHLGVLFRKGVLFTSGTSKGKALFKLCDHFNYAPKRIVFINDKITHLRDIEEEAIFRGVEFIGLRYSYMDERKNQFDPHVAEIQFTESGFHEILSDEEAALKKLQAWSQK